MTRSDRIKFVIASIPGGWRINTHLEGVGEYNHIVWEAIYAKGDSLFLLRQIHPDGESRGMIEEATSSNPIDGALQFGIGEIRWLYDHNKEMPDGH